MLTRTRRAVGGTDDSGTAHGTDGTDGTEDTDDTDGPDIPDGTLDEVLPIIDAHNIVACHGAVSPSAGLDLETDFCGTVVDGRLVVPGSTESLMYRRMTSEALANAADGCTRARCHSPRWRLDPRRRVLRVNAGARVARPWLVASCPTTVGGAAERF